MLSELKSKGIIDPALFISLADELNKMMQELKKGKNRLMEKYEEDELMRTARGLIQILEDGPEQLNTFDEAIFDSIVTQITAESSTASKFKLINGLELPEAKAI